MAQDPPIAGLHIPAAVNAGAQLAAMVTDVGHQY